MNVPMTERAAQYKFGTDFLDCTSSFYCENCHTSNYFPGDPVHAPREFACVCCGHSVVRKD